MQLAYSPYSVKYTYNYFSTLDVSFHNTQSLFGFFTFLIIANQLLSGIMLSFSLIPESMIIPLVRDEEDLEDLYTDDFFWLHERGVDLVFVFVFVHLFRKLYLHIIDSEQEYAWKSGAFTFLILQVVVFFGLVLCCTHLSEITLTIAANALHTFFLFKGKPYWWFFTDRLLNTDTIVRLAYGHYVSAFFLTFLGVVHGIDMHYDWKDESSADNVTQELSWWDEALTSEISKTCETLFWFWFISGCIYVEPEALSYEIFMWGDVGMVCDVRFYGVAPHWYFRPYMSWLIICPFHRIGILGLIYFFVVIYFQPNIMGFQELYWYTAIKTYLFNTAKKFINEEDLLRWQKIFIEFCIVYIFWYTIFLVSIACSLSFLPYGRFYNRLGGNFSMFTSFMFIFSYLGVIYFRYSILLKNFRLNIMN